MPAFSLKSEMPRTVFLFAHQDDEMGVFHVIERTISQGQRALCVYLTNGAWGGISPEARNAESTRVLAWLGVPKDDILFLGTTLKIPDGELPDHLAAVEGELHRYLARIPSIASFHLLAWEGGHQDHDAAHWIGIRQAVRFGVLTTTRQFSLYRRATEPALAPYVVAQPLSQNGPVEREIIPWRRRLAYLRLCGRYATQRKTMLGLVPFLAFDYAWTGEQRLQPVSPLRLDERPHPGPLLYETRGRYDFGRMQLRFRDAG